jgi:hypothetical protein
MNVEFEGTSEDTKCTSIITNFTNNSCTKVIKKDSTLCSCDYISDVVLLKRYIRPLTEDELLTYFRFNLMYEFLLGKIIILKAMIFVFFMLIGCVLDIKQSKTKPVFINETENDKDNNNE